MIPSAIRGTLSLTRPPESDMRRLVLLAALAVSAASLAGCRNSCGNLAASAALKWDVVAASAEQAATVMQAATAGLAAQGAAAGMGSATAGADVQPLRDGAELAREAAAAARADDWATLRRAAEAPAPGGLELDWSEAVNLSQQALGACAP